MSPAQEGICAIYSAPEEKRKCLFWREKRAGNSKWKRKRRGSERKGVIYDARPWQARHWQKREVGFSKPIYRETSTPHCGLLTGFVGLLLLFQRSFVVISTFPSRPHCLGKIQLLAP